MINSWHCTGPDALNWDCVVTSFSTSTESTGTSTVASSSQLYLSGFSYGEVIISLLLFLILTTLIFHTFWVRIFGTKLSVPFSRKFLGNNSKDGKEIKNI